VPFYSLFLEHDWKTALHNGEIFRDKIVVIGPSAPLLHDFHQTPVGEIAGPLVHVSAIAAALAGDFYTRSGRLLNAALLLAAAAAALGITWRFRHPVAALGVMAAVCAGYIGLVFVICQAADTLLPVLYPVYTLLTAGVACIAWNFGRERRETGRLRSTLDRYVSRNVVREILDNREDFLTALGGTRKPMAILFSDVRGFTSFSERADAVKVVEQLNEYLAEMVRIIFANNGTVDKFIGDGILAVWGNVVSEGPAIDAGRALRAAVEMRDQIQTLNERWRARGMQEFAVGIGVHHGDAVFGNIGSDQKMEPTVIGDAVNLASRVEGLTKKYGVTICVTEAAASLTGDEFILRSIDLVQVVGRTRPVEIFHPLTRRDLNVAPPWLERYEQAVRDFRSRNFAEAIEGFTACVEMAPGDKLCEIYLARARRLADNPPPGDWVGTEIATSK
jgi:adenylate cyclase